MHESSTPHLHGVRLREAFTPFRPGGAVPLLSFRAPHRCIDGACPHKGSTREPQRVLNRLKHPQVIVDSKNPVQVQHRWSIHGCTPFAMVALLNDGFHQARNRFRQSDRHAAGSDSIFAAVFSGLCQRAFLSAARNNGRAERPWRIVVLRARRERKSRAFMVDKGTPNLCAASLVGSPSRSQSSIAVRRRPGSFNNASKRIFRCSTRAHCSSGLGSPERGSIPGATSSSPVNTGSSGNSRRQFRLRNRIRDELMAIRWSQVENLARPWN